MSLALARARVRRKVGAAATVPAVAAVCGKCRGVVGERVVFGSGLDVRLLIGSWGVDIGGTLALLFDVGELSSISVTRAASLAQVKDVLRV